jgi:Skp family chaperone for outer membrane proteins
VHAHLATVRSHDLHSAPDKGTDAVDAKRHEEVKAWLKDAGELAHALDDNGSAALNDNSASKERNENQQCHNGNESNDYSVHGLVRRVEVRNAKTEGLMAR